MGRRRRGIEPLAVGYARAAPDEEDTLDTQSQAIQRYVEYRGWSLDHICSDEVPGSVPIEARPGGVDLLERVEQPGPWRVVVVRLQRLFASAAECVDRLDVWRAREVTLHVLELPGVGVVDLSSQLGGLVTSVLRAASEMEEEQQQRRKPPVELASLAKRKKGAKLLLGEKLVRGYVVPDPVEAHAVKRIQKLHEDGKSLRLIAEALDEEGVPTKRRAKHWSKEAIRLILQRVERGEVRDLRADDAEASIPQTDG